MAATPLASSSVDVAVFCLSLMGTNYGAFLQEAYRVLRPGAWLWIAEVRSRFASAAEDDPDGAAAPEDGGSGGGGVLEAFLRGLKQLGFRVRSRDESNRMFLALVLRKAKDDDGKVREAASIRWPELKPCTYKKR